MKLETAQALKWPWPCKDWEKREGWVVYRSPSVEEMLERMPPFYTVWNHTDGMYYGGHINESSTTFPYETAGEACAILCIWLRDNGLMEGWKSFDDTKGDFGPDGDATTPGFFIRSKP